MLEGFSWGHAFFEVNKTLLERYGECKDAEEVGQVQDAWLAQLEKEYAESREVNEDEDEWAGGNPNLLAESEDEEESDDQEEEDVSEEEETDERKRSVGVSIQSITKPESLTKQVITTVDRTI